MDTQFEAQSREVFARAREVDPRVPPFAETRILAALRERDGLKARKALRFWRAFSVATSAATIALAAWTVIRPETEKTLSAPVDSAVVVRVELSELKPAARIARVKIDLPSGVHFYSQGHDELSGLSSIVVSADAARTRSYLPFAIKADRPGLKPILVRFLDPSDAVVAERLIDIRFQDQKEKS